MKIEVEVFCVATPCSIAVGYQHFRGPCCLHLHTKQHHLTSKHPSLWSGYVL